MHANGKKLWIPEVAPRHVHTTGSLLGLVGHYQFDERLIAVSLRDGRLIAEFADGDERELVPIAEDAFFDSITASRITFRRDDRGHAVELTWDWPRCSMVAGRKKS